MFFYQYSLSMYLNHSIRMSDGQVMAKIQSWGLKTEQGKLPEQSSTLNAFLSPKGSEFGLTYFKQIGFPINLVYLNI